MRSDGQLVLFLRTGGKLINPWRAPQPNGTPGSRLDLQDDGNVIIRDSTGVIRWSTDTVRDCDGIQHFNMKAMTFNLASGDLAFPIDLSMRSQAVFLKEKAPDIVFLQEVDDNCSRTRRVRQAKTLAILAEMSYWYFSPSFAGSGCAGSGWVGDAILAKGGNMVFSQTIPLLFPWHYSQSTSITRVDYNFGGVTVTLIDQHWPLWGKNDCLSCHEITVMRLIEEIDKLGGRPIILGGDFNQNVDAKYLALVKAKGFVAASEEAVEKRLSVPDVPIDHILFRGLPDLKVLIWEKSPKDVLSDHGVGMATFQFTQQWEKID